jgi:hypothetical protein
MLRYILVLTLLLTLILAPALLTQQAQSQDLSGFDFIVGPQVPITNSWFDQTEIERAKVHGAKCPDVPPTDPAALNDYVLLNYYDLPLTEYVAYQRTKDPVFLAYARKCADAWWQHPQWIKSGTKLDFENGEPVPRHAGIGGLILRALDGRPEMWDWIVAYTRYEFDIWLGLRVNNSSLHYGVREGAFMLHYAAWLAATHPDLAVRAEFLTKAENISVNYFGRLQYPDGSWRWDTAPDEFVDTDGGTLQGITQPFMVGLLLNALIDVHRLSTNGTVKASIQRQLTQSCLNLFNHSYRRFEPTGIPGVNWRSFWYFDHGGTSINPRKYEFGGGSYTAADISSQGTWVIANERQLTATIFSAYAYAYLLTGDPAFREAGAELVDAAFVGTDGFRGFAADTAKNYSQTYRMGGRYFAWRIQTPGSEPISTSTPSPTPSLAASPSPSPTPTPLPSPSPTPMPTPTPTPTPSPSPTPRCPFGVLPNGKCRKH